MQQLSLFPEENIDPRTPISANWNLWHGCTRASTGCLHCYMYRRDESLGKDPSLVRMTEDFDLPVRVLRAGKNKGRYKIPHGSHIYTCFSSDFFHPAADEWRDEAWAMIKERSDCSFFMITKRPERIADHLPSGWGEVRKHVIIAVTCENQEMADKRLPIYLSLPLFHHSVMLEPMLSAVDLQPYIDGYRDAAGVPVLRHVTVGGESGPGARLCDFSWVKDIHRQCSENGLSLYYHQTGARLIKDGKLYNIPRPLQHSQAHMAGVDIAET